MDNAKPDLHAFSFAVTQLEQPAPVLPAEIEVYTASEVTSPATMQLLKDLGDMLLLQQSTLRVSKLEDVGTEFDFKDKFVIIAAELDRATTMQVDEETLLILKKLAATAKGALWLATNRPSGSIIRGLWRSLRNEEASSCLGVLNLDWPQRQLGIKAVAQTIIDSVASLANTDSGSDNDREFQLQDGQVRIERLLPDSNLSHIMNGTESENPTTAMSPFRNKTTGGDLKVGIGRPGMLDTLQFVPGNRSQQELKVLEVEIEVKAVGLNFRDVMVAMGQLQDDVLGIECSGVVTRVGAGVGRLKEGDRVYGFSPGCFRGLARVDSRAFCVIPAQLSFEEAATIPCAFATSYYALADVARLEAGESVLIHSAAGAVGQAAIRVAQHLGAVVYATVSSQAKIDLLVSQCGINPAHIFNSRDLSFKDAVHRVTNGKGVDVVLNSLAGEALRQSWLCVAPFGRFVELGKRDIYDNTGLDMLPFVKNISFCGVDLFHQTVEAPIKYQKLLQKLSNLMTGNVFKPLPYTSYGLNEVQDVFRTMQSGKHTGKLVIRCDDDILVKVNIYPQTLKKNYKEQSQLDTGLGFQL